MPTTKRWILQSLFQDPISDPIRTRFGAALPQNQPTIPHSKFHFNDTKEEEGNASVDPDSNDLIKVSFPILIFFFFWDELFIS